MFLQILLTLHKNRHIYCIIKWTTDLHTYTFAQIYMFVWSRRANASQWTELRDIHTFPPLLPPHLLPTTPNPPPTHHRGRGLARPDGVFWYHGYFSAQTGQFKGSFNEYF